MNNNLPKNSFLGLQWKGFLWVSLLLIGLSSAFYALNHYYLTSQFHNQRHTEIMYLQRQVEVLLTRTTDRLVRLSGALASMINFNEAIQRDDFGRIIELIPADSYYENLGYELDIHQIGFYTTDADLIWQWPQPNNSKPDHQNWIQGTVNQVKIEEKPISLLTCKPNCLLYAFVPILENGQNIGVMTIVQSIADFIIEFHAVTNTDLVLIMPPSPEAQQDDLHIWSARIAGITNKESMTPLVHELTKRFKNQEVLKKGQIVNWQNTSYDIHSIPLSTFITGVEGASLFISDVTDRLDHIDEALKQGLLLTIIALVIAELGLLYLVGVPIRRLKELARRLPLLAAGNYKQISDYFHTHRDSRLLRDEIDILYESALTLSDQLNENSKAIAKKNQELEMDRDFIQGLLTSAQVLVITQTNCGVIRMANEFAMQLTGFPSNQLHGRSFVDLINDTHGKQSISRQIKHMRRNGRKRLEHEHTLITSNGDQRQIVWVHAPLKTQHADGSAILSVGLDVTKRVEAESRMRWLANHDQLTGLVNRRRFLEEITRVMHESKRSHQSSALLLYDLDHFKEINDTSGHAAGDAVLRMIAKEIQDRARKSDIVARLGGDEFGVLMPHTDGNGALSFAQELIELIKNMVFPYGEKRHRIGVSIGIALIPHHGHDVHELMANADLAMFEAKRAGRSQSKLFTYDQEQANQLTQNIYWKDILIRALTEDHLFFHMQPIVNTVTNEIIYYEALLRLHMKNGHIAMPGEFLSSGQRAGLSYEIDLYVVRLALKILQTDKSKCLSINLSTHAFINDSWVQLLISAVSEEGFDSSRLIFEITETSIIADMEKAKNIANTIALHGFKFAVDDFGTGFSSLYYLKQLPIAYVKLDRSLVKHIATDENERNFVHAITTMVHAFGKQVVGEGVEDINTLLILRDLNVDFAQGYFIGRPTDRY